MEHYLGIDVGTSGTKALIMDARAKVRATATAEHELLHHTLGRVDYDYQREIFSRVTADAVVVRHPTEAPGQIDRAIETLRAVLQ